MKISVDSTLMQNHKHAVVMAPDVAFQTLQSADGDAVFFSIGTDGVCYLTREVIETPTGWTRIDLSSGLSAQYGGAAVVAKTFAVSQDSQTLGVDIALVVTVDGVDFLYLSLGNANTDASWAGGVTWTPVPFDAGTAPGPLTIADVLLQNLPVPGGPGSLDNIFVDILRTPGDPQQLLDRYYIQPGGSPQWNRHALAADLSAGSISSCLGRRVNDPVPGIYTFGTIADEPELLFTPQYNYFRPSTAPSPARLALPAGAGAVASALDDAGASNLFVAAADGLYLFTPDNQHDQAAPVRVIADSPVAGATTLAAAGDATRTSVWALGPQGVLCYTTCPAGDETDPAAWSAPVPLLPSVEAFAFFRNADAGNHVLFAHVDGQQLVSLTQDPVTTDWRQRDVLLPAADRDDVVAFTSYTTHVTVTDDDGRIAPDAGVTVTATSPVGVYLNDVYHTLSPTVPVGAVTDITGVLTVVQATQSLAGVCFRIALSDTPDVTADVNPMSKALATLSSVQSGQDLRDVVVTNADATTQPLVPASVATADSDAAAQALAQFTAMSAGLPADGSRQATAADLTAMWGMSFTGGRVSYHEGDDAIGMHSRAVAARGIGSDIAVAAGDFFAWLENTGVSIGSFVVQQFKGAYHLLATIKGEVFDVVLDCVAAIGHAAEFVLGKIEVFFQDLIKWLGFLFVWPDIVRTHQVMKNIIITYLAQCVDGLGTTGADLRSAFTDVIGYVDGWAGIADDIPPSLTGVTQGNTLAGAAQAPGQGSPQSNWGMHHLKSNMGQGTTTAQQGFIGDISAVLQPLASALGTEQKIFQDACDSVKTGIIDRLDELSFTQLIEAIVAIIGDTLLEGVENVLVTVPDVLTALVDGAMDVLKATVDIPVLSSVYREATGDDLGLLDVLCLVAAIPVTVAYKLLAGSAPFPDDATTNALIIAPDFATITRICAQAGDSSGAVHALDVPASLNNILGLAGGIASGIGAAILSVTVWAAKKEPEDVLPPILTGAAYPLYVLPDLIGQIPDLQNKKWWAIANNAIADLMIVKTLVDTRVALKPQPVWSLVSPWIDFGANIAWQVPTTAALFDPENQNVAGLLNFIGNSCFDYNGVLSPLLADDSEPLTWLAAVVAAAGLNIAYGATSCAAGLLPYDL